MFKYTCTCSELLEHALCACFQATGQEIPMVVRSCVRVINLHGRYHQGVFRVSGSQHEILEFKSAFEKGV